MRYAGNAFNLLVKLLSLEEPWTLILDDALANSFIAPVTEDIKDDHQLTFEEYERSWEQNEELGLNDIDTSSADGAYHSTDTTMQGQTELSGIYKNVIATDTSPKQLAFAPRLPNIRYQLTPPTMSIAELESSIAPQSSIDVVTIAQAIHWFDLPNFYQQAKWVLKKPHGVIAAWCYTVPEVNESVDAVFQPYDNIAVEPYWGPARELVDNKYETIDFPFEPVDGADHTGPFPFVTERLMDLDSYFTYLRSWSAYQTAKEKGVELLSNDVIEEFKRAWTEDGQDKKVVKHPIYLRIGRVGNE